MKTQAKVLLLPMLPLLFGCSDLNIQSVPPPQYEYTIVGVDQLPAAQAIDSTYYVLSPGSSTIKVVTEPDPTNLNRYLMRLQEQGLKVDQAWFRLSNLPCGSDDYLSPDLIIKIKGTPFALMEGVSLHRSYRPFLYCPEVKYRLYQF